MEWDKKSGISEYDYYHPLNVRDKERYMDNREKCFKMAKNMLNFKEDDNLDDKLKCMLIDSCEMTEKLDGIFLSRQAIAVIVTCWSHFTQ